MVCRGTWAPRVVVGSGESLILFYDRWGQTSVCRAALVERYPDGLASLLTPAAGEPTTRRRGGEPRPRGSPIVPVLNSPPASAVAGEAGLPCTAVTVEPAALRVDGARVERYPEVNRSERLA